MAGWVRYHGHWTHAAHCLLNNIGKKYYGNEFTHPMAWIFSDSPFCLRIHAIFNAPMAKNPLDRLS